MIPDLASTSRCLLALVVIGPMSIDHVEASPPRITWAEDPSRQLHVEFSEPSDGTPVQIEGDGLTPLYWSPAIGTREGTLPALLAPGSSGDDVQVRVNGEPITLPPAPAEAVRVRIDSAVYAAHSTDASIDRIRGLWLVLTAMPTLLLARVLVRGRRGTLAVIAVAIAWSAGLAVAITRRPNIDRVADARLPGRTWLIARRPGVARLPIAPGEPWRPTIESLAHLRALTPRLVVDASDAAALELTLGVRDARVAVDATPR